MVLNLIWICFWYSKKKVHVFGTENYRGCTSWTAPVHDTLLNHRKIAAKMVRMQKKLNLRISQIQLSHFYTVSWTGEQHPECFLPATEHPLCILIDQRFWIIWLGPALSENASAADSDPHWIFEYTWSCERGWREGSTCSHGGSQAEMMHQQGLHQYIQMSVWPWQQVF